MPLARKVLNDLEYFIAVGIIHVDSSTSIFLLAEFKFYFKGIARRNGDLVCSEISKELFVQNRG